MIVNVTADGRRYNIRVIRPDDRDHLVRGLEQMSPATRYQRFHGERTDFTSGELDFLVACDGVDHIAYVSHGVDYRGQETEGAGVARFYRDPEQPDWGEVAIVVVDGWQNVGLGSVLLGILADHCRKTCVKGWKASIVGDNDRAIHVFSKIGTVTQREWVDRSIVLHILLA